MVGGGFCAVSSGLLVLHSYRCVDRPDRQTLLGRMDFSRTQQRSRLRDRIPHRAIRLHSGQRLLHRALRGKSPLLAQTRNSLIYVKPDRGSSAGLSSRAVAAAQILLMAWFHAT